MAQGNLSSFTILRRALLPLAFLIPVAVVLVVVVSGLLLIKSQVSKNTPSDGEASQVTLGSVLPEPGSASKRDARRGHRDAGHREVGRDEHHPEDVPVLCPRRPRLEETLRDGDLSEEARVLRLRHDAGRRDSQGVRGGVSHAGRRQI